LGRGDVHNAKMYGRPNLFIFVVIMAL
jgi:hypothetical protein